jgi:Ni,Fe-hydrogenase III large subunit
MGAFARKESATSTTIYPLGPYHPALPLPLGLELKLQGETVTAVERPATGYCRRGVEALLSGMPVERALPTIERTCSFAGSSHRLALCQAIEAATGVAPSGRDRLIRGIFAEVERLLARLWTLGMSARAAGLYAPFRDAMDQRETLFDALESATGERLYWAIPVPGGVRELDAPSSTLDGLRIALASLQPAIDTWHVAVGTRGPLGRAGAGVGKINAEQSSALSLTGLAARAAGRHRDLRRDEPYGPYADLAIEWPGDRDATSSDADVAARLALAVEDAQLSARIAAQCFAALANAEDTSLVDGRAGRSDGRAGRGAVEGPHGVVEVRVTLAAGGTIDRASLQVPGVQLVDALPALLEGQAISVVPLLLASLDLCMECVDL